MSCDIYSMPFDGNVYTNEAMIKQLKKAIEDLGKSKETDFISIEIANVDIRIFRGIDENIKGDEPEIYIYVP